MFNPFSLTPADRTSELRKKGFEGRRLGPTQMTTDTAVRVTRIVVEEKSTCQTTLPLVSHNSNEVLTDNSTAG